MKHHPGITNPYALAWSMHGRGYRPGAGQVGTEFEYATIDPPPDVVTVGTTAYAPPAIPGLPRGPAFGPAGPPVESTPEQLAAMAPGYGGPPGYTPEQIAELTAMAPGYGGPPGDPQVTITTVAEPPPEEEDEKKPIPWGWIIGGSAAVAAVVAGGVYVAARSKKRRRRRRG
jgi:hypothetical protein